NEVWQVSPGCQRIYTPASCRETCIRGSVFGFHAGRLYVPFDLAPLQRPKVIDGAASLAMRLARIPRTWNCDQDARIIASGVAAPRGAQGSPERPRVAP